MSDASASFLHDLHHISLLLESQVLNLRHDERDFSLGKHLGCFINFPDLEGALLGRLPKLVLLLPLDSFCLLDLIFRVRLFSGIFFVKCKISGIITKIQLDHLLICILEKCLGRDLVLTSNMWKDCFFDLNGHFGRGGELVLGIRY